jgi:hypothetical protein
MTSEIHVDLTGGVLTGLHRPASSTGGKLVYGLVSHRATTSPRAVKPSISLAFNAFMPVRERWHRAPRLRQPQA